MLPFIQAADDAVPQKETGQTQVQVDGLPRNALVDLHAPEDLVKRFALSLPSGDGLGKDGVLDIVQRILQYSVNTWDQGFLDKLYSSTNAVRTVVVRNKEYKLILIGWRNIRDAPVCTKYQCKLS